MFSPRNAGLYDRGTRCHPLSGGGSPTARVGLGSRGATPEVWLGGIEPPSKRWQRSVLAVERQPHGAREPGGARWTRSCQRMRLMKEPRSVTSGIDARAGLAPALDRFAGGRLTAQPPGVGAVGEGLEPSAAALTGPNPCPWGPPTSNVRLAGLEPARLRLERAVGLTISPIAACMRYPHRQPRDSCLHVGPVTHRTGAHPRSGPVLDHPGVPGLVERAGVEPAPPG